MFEPVAHELRGSGVVRVERSSASHLFFTIGDEAVGLARPTEDGWAVEVLLTDRGDGTATHGLALELRILLQHYTVTGPNPMDEAE